MRWPIDDEIRQIFDRCSSIFDGEVATYIPELAAADPTAHGLCVCRELRASCTRVCTKPSLPTTCDERVKG